ncbi:MAG: cobalt-precorrin-6A reductase [Rhodospirillales bacterium]|jgi:precorrin-6A/cobalt-precorrin-6A reductase|nr:cobalt-precorrin-6A reductase [Rhodospirillales bacterium]
MVDHAVLILGGTSLALELAKSVQGMAVRSIYSLAGRTTPKSLPDMEVRVGGFGGVDALSQYLRAENITAVIDATHAYAAQISVNAQMACENTSVPLLRLQEAPWRQEDGDNWITVLDVAAARDEAAKIASRVFVSTGRQSVADFVSDPRCWWLLRVVPTDETLPAFQNGEYVYERGPFDLTDELALMREHSIETIISKNAGSKATYAKIIAARELSLPVIMINRPESGSTLQVGTVPDAIGWLVSVT